MRIYKTLISAGIIISIITWENSSGVIYTGGALQGKYAEISRVIQCLHYFHTQDRKYESSEGLINAKSHLEKLLDDKSLKHNNVAEAISFATRGIAQVEIDIELRKLFCGMYIAEDARKKYFK